MQISVNKDLLLKSLAKVQSIVERRSTVPILEHVKVDVMHSHMKLTTTNSEIMISDVFPVKSNVVFSFTTVATILYEIVRKIYDTQEINFAVENEGTLLIRAGRSRFKLPCLSASEFPRFDTNITECIFSTNAASILYLFEHTKHAICSGETRYYLNGAFFHIAHKVEENSTSQVLRVVATDSFRFASAEVSVNQDISNKFGIVVPRRTINEVLKIVTELNPDAVVQVAADSNRVVFSMQDTQLASKIVDARFPDYSEIVKIKHDSMLTVNVRDLRCAIDLVTAASDAKDKEIKLLIEPETINISIEDTSMHQSYGSQTIQAIFNQSEKAELLLNSRYLLDCIGVIKGDIAEIGIGVGLSPIIVKDRDDSNSLYVLMPLSTQ